MTYRHPHRHRGQYGGRDDAGRQYHLAKLWSQIAASRELCRHMRPMGRELWHIPAGLTLRWRDSLDDVLPYLDDDEGRIRL